MEISQLHWQRILKLYEDYILSGDIDSDRKCKYYPVMFNELPAWCRGGSIGFP